MSESKQDKKIKDALVECFKEEIINEIGLGFTGNILLKDIKISFTAFRLDCGDDNAPDHIVDMEYEHKDDIE